MDEKRLETTGLAKQEHEERIERIKSLLKSTIPDKEIDLQKYDEWYFDRERNVLYYKEDSVRDMTDRQLIGETLKNIGCIQYSGDAKNIIKSSENPNGVELPADKRSFALLANMVEDIRVQEQFMQQYPGAYDSFLYHYKKTDASISSKVEAELDRRVQFLFNLLREFWGEDLPKNLHPDVREALEEASQPLYEAFTANSAEESLRKIVDDVWAIYERLIDKDKKEEEEKKKQRSPEAQQLIDKMSQAFEFMEDIVPDMKKMSEKYEAGAPGEKESFKTDVDKEFDEREARSKQYGGDDFKNSDFPTNGHEEPTLAEKDFLSYEVMYAEIAKHIPYFKKKLSSIMEDNNYNREGGAHRSGKLNTNKLYKIKCKTDRLFQKKIIRRHKDYAVTLLIDESGSMCSDEKNRNAAKGAILLSEVLNKVGIPFEIRAFNETFRLYKQFDERFTWKQRRNLERVILNSHGGDAGGNHDGFAVNKASYHLNNYGGRNTERILIVLSDGYPAGYTGQEVPAEDRKRLPLTKRKMGDFDLSHEIAQAEKTTYVIGVGIAAKNVQEYYKDNVVVDDVSELPTNIMRVLKKKIRRG